MQFIKDRNVRLNISPASNILLGSSKSYEEHPVKKIVEAGIRVSIGTDDLMFFNKSVSEQCADLVNAGVFTVEQIKKIFISTVKDYE